MSHCCIAMITVHAMLTASACAWRLSKICRVPSGNAALMDWYAERGTTNTRQTVTVLTVCRPKKSTSVSQHCTAQCSTARHGVAQYSIHSIAQHSTMSSCCKHTGSWLFVHVVTHSMHSMANIQNSCLVLLQTCTGYTRACHFIACVVQMLMLMIGWQHVPNRSTQQKVLLHHANLHCTYKDI